MSFALPAAAAGAIVGSDRSVVPARRSGEVRSLTGLRGVAAFLVMIYHFTSGKLGGPMVLHGYIAVDLFFVLSGYVMARTYGGAFVSDLSWRTYRHFLGRRMARIYPLYLLLLLMTVALSQVTIIGNEVRLTSFSLAANIALIQTWGLSPSINPPSWSISTELLAYLLFPAFVVAFLQSSRRQAVATGAICALVILALSLVPDVMRGENAAETGRVVGPLNLSDGTKPWAAIRCLMEFGLGLLSWRLTGWQPFAKAGRSAAPSLVAGLSLVLLWVVGSDVVFVLVLVPLIGLLSFDRGIVARILGSRILHFLGNVSYAVYLVQSLSQSLISPLAAWIARSGLAHGWMISVLLVAALTIATSSGVYLWFEKPAQRLVRRSLTARRLS